MHLRKPIILIAASAAMIASAAHARDSLGVFEDWGAFRDADTPRCYAIAKAAPSTQQRDNDPFASIGTWPRQAVRNQLHFRMSRNIRKGAAIQLTISGRSFTLTGSAGNAWAQSQTMDAAIVSAMRSARQMVVRSTDSSGRRFSNTYDLSGAATAMDAATVGCANIRQAG